MKEREFKMTLEIDGVTVEYDSKTKTVKMNPTLTYDSLMTYKHTMNYGPPGVAQLMERMIYLKNQFADWD